MEAPLKPKNIVWVVMDTLRADHLGLYGYPRPTSPFLDELAKEALVFDWAFSTCPYSNPSHTSMLTGLYPSNHYQGFSNGSPQNQPPGEALLAKALLNDGYETASFVSMNSPVHLANSAVNFGFQKKLSVEMKAENKEQTETLITFIDSRADHNLFLFINFFDVHGPYLHQEPHRSLFTSDPWMGPPLHFKRISPSNDPLGGLPAYQLLEQKLEHGLLREYQTDLHYYIAQYDAGIRKVDQALKGLVEHIKMKGLYDETLLIVAADHGEAFGENGLYCTHSYTLTPDQTHVPLLLKPHRGWPVKTGRIGTHVSLVDLMPTILELTGIDHGKGSLDGRSLVGLVQGQGRELEERTILAETCFQTCFIDRENLNISTRTEDEISALKPKEPNFPGSVPIPRTESIYKESVNLKYRTDRPSPLGNPPASLFFQPLPWMDEQKLDLALAEIRQKAVAELLCSTGAIIPTLDHMLCELNRLRGELHSIPAPIRWLVKLLRSWPWLRKIVGRLRRIGRDSSGTQQ